MVNDKWKKENFYMTMLGYILLVSIFFMIAVIGSIVSETFF